MESGAEDGKVKMWRAAFRSVLADLPESYSNAAPTAATIRKVFHEEMARAVEPRLNAHLKTQPHETYDDKKTLCSWVNHQLHYVLGLTIRCERTKEPAILVADLRDHRSNSRFRLEVVNDMGRKEKTLSSVQIPELRLMEDPPRREAFSSWRPPSKDSARSR